MSLLLRNSPPSPEERKSKIPRVKDHYVEDLMDIFKDFKLNEKTKDDDLAIDDLVKSFSKIKTRNLKDRELRTLMKDSYVTDVMSDISKIKSSGRITRSIVKAAKAFESFMDVNASSKASTSKASTSKASTSKARTSKATTSKKLVPIKEEPDSPEKAFVHFIRTVKTIKKEPKNEDDLIKNANTRDKMEEGGAPLNGALIGGASKPKPKSKPKSKP